MESVVDSTGYELRVLHAAADGVEPALLLSAPGKKAEYLLNVPDGFSRLALEHKSIPSGRLSCILLTSLLPAATGGLGGLMLRLRHDGHGQVQMIGPRGATALVHSLRHICRWRYPKVFVSECWANRPPPVFEDDHIVIVPIVDGDLTAVCLWCLYGTSESSTTDQQKNVADLLSRASSTHDCSSSCSSGSSVASEDSSDTDCCSQEIPSDPRRGSNIILPLRRKREGNPRPVSDEEHNFFKQVRLKLDKSKRKRINVCAVLPDESLTKQLPENGSGGELGVLPTLRLCTKGEEEETTAKPRQETGNSRVETYPRAQQPVYGLGSEDVKKMQENPVIPSVKRFDWLIQNCQEVELPDLGEESNPVFQLSPGPEKQQDTASDEAESTGLRKSSVLGYVCYLRNLRTAVLIVDCKSKEHSERLRAHPLLSCRNHPRLSCKDGEESKGKMESLIAAVVDLSPRSIIESRYHEVCMESIRGSASQVIVKGVNGEFGFQSSLATLAKLNCIHELIFPLPPRMDICSKVAKTSSKEATGVDEKILNAALCMRLIFQKSGTSVDYSMCPVKLKKVQEERRQKDGDSEDTRRVASLPANGTPVALSANGAAAAALRRTLQDRSAGSLPSNPALQSSTSGETDLSIEHGGQLQSLNGSKHSISHRAPIQVHEDMNLEEVVFDFQLVFFGTGCAEPSKKRGSSGILLQVKGTDRAMLMEAGEGVAGQFVRRFGDVKAESFICSLECLWLSHKHGDHVLGVLSVLEARRLQKESLVVIGPQKVGVWLSEVKEVRAAMGCPMPEFHFIPCQDITSGRFLESKEDRKFFDRVLCRMKLQSLRIIRVFHCFDAHGIILRGKTGWSIVYSGDTRPCKALERAGHGCSVLIHEATFEDGLIEQARQKRHSTVSEALKTGMQMGAQHIILTHFSQRYPEMVSMCCTQNQKVAVAFDGMVVPSHLLDSLSKLLPLVTSLFQKSDETKALISGQDENHSAPNNHVPPVQGTGLTHSSSKELEDDEIDSRQLTPASIDNFLPRFNTKCEKRSNVEAKHIRWCEDSDDVDLGGLRTELDAANVTVKWSSDSENDEVFQLPLFKDRLRPRVRVVEINGKADTSLVRKSSLATARESSFDTVLTPVSKFCADGEESQRQSVERPRNHEHGCVSLVDTIPRNNIMKGGVQAAVHPILQQVEGDYSLGTCLLNETGERSRLLPTVVEGHGNQSGKHIRWHDFDFED